MIIESASMQGYFREMLTVCLAQSKTALTEEVQAYVVHLLVHFGNAQEAYAGFSHGEKPSFTLLLSRALETNEHEALKIYRYVGDISLYHLGFFVEAMEHAIHNPSYYALLGKQGYAAVASLSRDTNEGSYVLFSELSERFQTIVHVLNRMKIESYLHRFSLPDSATVLQWIEQYKKTKDPELLKALQKLGLELEKSPLAQMD